MAQGITRNQHWIPQFYLKQFCDSKERLCVYRKENDAFFRASPSHVCSKRDLYEVEHRVFADGHEKRLFAQNTIERLLSDAEARIAPKYNCLIDCCNMNTTTGKEYHDGKLAVCALVANLLSRHPLSLSKERKDAPQRMREWMSNYELTQEEIKLLDEVDWLGDYEALTELAILAVLLFSKDKRVPQRKMFEAFSKKKMTILKAPKFYSFITTSLPIMIIGPENTDYHFDFAFFPLSSGYAALFSDDELGVGGNGLDDDRPPNWNQWLLWNGISDREIIPLDYAWTTHWNRMLLLNCASWDIAFSRTMAPLERAVSEWKLSDQSE